MKNILILSLLISQLVGSLATAAILSPSSIELKISFTASFFTTDLEEDIDELIENHYQHLFGIFQSPTMVKKYGIYEYTGGMAAPKLPLKIKVTKDEVKDGVRTVAYSSEGLMLVNKHAALKLIKDRSLQITLPTDLDNFYERKCTDEHYTSQGDFWYFYDPFRYGCSKLRNSPMAQKVVIQIHTQVISQKNYSARLNELRGDNGNGDVVDIVTVNGFSESSTESEDEGRVTFNDLNDFLIRQGFKMSSVQKYENRPILRFEKDVKAADGRVIKFRVTRLLAETSISSKNVTFAKFFKKAIETADVVMYSGHSGLGGTLDIPSLESKAGDFVFDHHKRQIYFFDGCSSYSYYLSTFESHKNKSKIDILTNGLASFFHTQNEVIEGLLTHIFAVDTNPTWMDILNTMEAPLGEDTYMLSVGAL